MAWQVELTPAARRQLKKLDPQTRKRIAEKIDLLTQDPMPPGVKRLQRPGGEYRVRVGDHRIIYTLDGGRLLVWIVKIGNRRDVYDS